MSWSILVVTQAVWKIRGDVDLVDDTSYLTQYNIHFLIQKTDTPTTLKQIKIKSTKGTERDSNSGVSVVCMLSWWWCGHILVPYRFEETSFIVSAFGAASIHASASNGLPKCSPC